MMYVNASKIKEMILEKGFSMASFKEASGISHGTIYHLGNDVRKISDGTAAKIAKTLGVSLNDICITADQLYKKLGALQDSRTEAEKTGNALSLDMINSQIEKTSQIIKKITA